MNITDENFDNELNATDKFVLVDFFAEWCGPCQTLGPIIEKVAEDFKDNVVLVKANVDKFPKTSAKFNINSIPAVFLFKDGKVINNFTGLVPEHSIREWLENSIENSK